MDSGRRAYLQAVEDAFGADIDYGILVMKLYGAETSGQGHVPEPNAVRIHAPVKAVAGASQSLPA